VWYGRCPDHHLACQRMKHRTTFDAICTPGERYPLSNEIVDQAQNVWEGPARANHSFLCASEHGPGCAFSASTLAARIIKASKALPLFFLVRCVPINFKSRTMLVFCRPTVSVALLQVWWSTNAKTTIYA